MESNQPRAPPEPPGPDEQIGDPGSSTPQGTTGRHKRQLNTPSCITCRTRKRACDGKRPKCSQCETPTASGIPRECVYPAFVKRRGPGRSKQRMIALENRLRELEASLQNSGSSASPPPVSIPDPGVGHPFHLSTFAPVAVNAATPTTTVAGSSVATTTPSQPSASAPSLTSGDGFIPGSNADGFGLGPSSGGTIPTLNQPPAIIPPHGSELALLAHSFDHLHAELPVCGSIRRFRMRIRRVVAAVGQGPYRFVTGGPPLTSTPGSAASPGAAATSSEAGQPGGIIGGESGSASTQTTPPTTIITPSSFAHPARWAWVNSGIALALHARTANRSFCALALFAWSHFNNAYAYLPQLLLAPVKATASSSTQITTGPGTTAATTTNNTTTRTTTPHRQEKDDPFFTSPLSLLTETVQSLLWMSQFLLGGSADARAALSLLSAAGRIAQVAIAIATTTTSSGSGSNSSSSDSNAKVEAEDARRAIWAVAVLDAELALSSGLAPSLISSLVGDEEEVALPALHPDTDGVLAAGGQEQPRRQNPDETAVERGWASVFRWRAELAEIHAEVRRRLYSPKALAASSGDKKGREEAVLKDVLELERMMEEWRRKIPEGLRPVSGRIVEVPGSGLVVSTASPEPLEMHCVVLHLVFYGLSGMVHWAARRCTVTPPATGGSVLVGNTNTVYASPLLPELDMTRAVAEVCRRKNRAAAQLTLRLLRDSPIEQFAHFWRHLRYPLSAALTLLLHVLERPSDPEAAGDVQLLATFRRQVAQMQSESDVQLQGLMKACSAIEGFAAAAVARARSGGVVPMEVLSSLPCSRETIAYVVENILRVLQLCTHPLWLAQGLLTNLPNRDWENAQELSRLLGVPPNPARAGGFGTLVPESLKPWQFVAKVESGGGEGEA
ncbi:hypothetical protein VTJ04DRAFT_6897 [Mycothermus thermophilus]|uniref:uncharacterized protein n=1 Tax=Humicola insolens TaxID=85995 RepID=UPI0037429723